MACYIGLLYGVVLMPVELLASHLISLHSLSRDLHYKKSFKIINAVFIKDNISTYRDMICL